MPEGPRSWSTPSPMRRTAPSMSRPGTSITTCSASTRPTGRISPCFTANTTSFCELDGLYHYFYGKDKVPMKLEPGNTNYELAWGSAGIVDYLDTLGGGTGDRAAITRAYDDDRGARGRSRRTPPRLSARPQRHPHHRPSFERCRQARAHDIVQGRRTRIRVRSCAKPTRMRLASGSAISIRGDWSKPSGSPRDGGVVRVSMVHYNTIAEVDRLIGSLDRALQ